VPPRWRRFTEPAPPAPRDQVRLLAAGSLALFLALGAGLSLVEVSAVAARTRAIGHRVTIETSPIALPPPPQQPRPDAAAPAAPPRLDPATILSQNLDRAVPAEAQTPPRAAPRAAESAPSRRVFGVSRVYARGLGASTADASGLITKRGNTTSGPPDTLTATDADLRGELAALSTVDQAPVPISRIKPEYSPALIAARASGTVAAYLLVDVDGRVRDVHITEDIGHDSRAVAAAAFARFSFQPALKNGKPVAVWILHRIRFEFQE
jgi:hypothetical protein